MSLHDDFVSDMSDDVKEDADEMIDLNEYSVYKHSLEGKHFMQFMNFDLL